MMIRHLMLMVLDKLFQSNSTQINEGIEEKFETVTGASGVTALDC